MTKDEELEELEPRICLDCNGNIDAGDCRCANTEDDAYEEGRDRYDDDGVEYADPRDFRDELLDRD